MWQRRKKERKKPVEKIELMHSVYGKRENGVCWDCHFCHWKIAGKGESRYIASKWCEIYGINKQNIAETEWRFKNPACGIYNLDHEPPHRQIWKMAKNTQQLSLF